MRRVSECGWDLFDVLGGADIKPPTLMPINEREKRQQAARKASLGPSARDAIIGGLILYEDRPGDQQT